MVKVTAVALHTPEQVRDIIMNALSISEDIGPPEHLDEAVFTQACQLLGARAPVVEQERTVPFDLGRLAG